MLIWMLSVNHWKNLESNFMSKCVPIILLASERSGTNLLRAMVSSHSKVSSPPPAGMVGALAGRAFHYLSPLKPLHKKELVDDVIALTKAHLSPWGIDINPQVLLEKQNAVSFWHIFKSINDIYAEEEGNMFWFSKEPDLFNYVYEIKLHMPDVKFIYMARDGRDVAASMLKGGVHANHISGAAHIWSSNQRACLNALSDTLLSDSMFAIKYEDLITDAEVVMQDLMKFIGLDYESSQIEYYKNKNIIEHSKKSEFWTNISKPLNPLNKEKYKNNLSVKQIEIFEGIAWDEMQSLNYPLVSNVRKRFSLFDKIKFRLSNVISRMLKYLKGGNETKQQNERDARFRKILNRSFYD